MFPVHLYRSYVRIFVLRELVEFIMKYINGACNTEISGNS